MYCPVCRSDYPDDWKVCPKDTTALLRSPQIGKYRIEGLLGTGGMGAVYKAFNPDTKGRVAIKIMNPAVASAESARARFQREAAAVAALRTAHVVKVFDFGTDDGTLYLVMELLEGHTLRDEIQPAPDTIDLARVQMIIDGALKGLAAAHKAGIVHRDLKPENVYVTETDDGEIPKLLDFGIARVRTKDSDLTLTGSLMGTAAYMAVEQVAPDHGEIGPWSDVYAMGAILYEMLAGAPACGGETVTAVLQKVLRHEIVPLEELRPGLPGSIYTLVEKCLHIDPTARPPDADAMRSAFTAARLVSSGTEVPRAAIAKPPSSSQVGLLATAPSKDTLPSKPPTIEELRPDKRKPNVSVLAAIAVVAGGAVLLAVKLLGRRHAEEDADAAVVAARDAAMLDQAIAAPPIDASLRPQGMLALAGGERTLGEPPNGHPDALPVTRVTLKELWIDQTEVTLDVVRAVLANDKVGGVKADDAGFPARMITWAQADATCRAQRKRLPTELEWEAAALTTPADAATATLMRGKAQLTITPRKECSADGLCDILGSVLEWTATDGDKPGTKIVRGASYQVSPEAGWLATVHARLVVKATEADAEIGFRCVKDPE